jgi:hypothetical protein
LEQHKPLSFPNELGASLLILLLAAAFVVGLADVEAKYKIALLAAIGGSAVMAAVSERRALCVVLWVMIHPLGVEKVFFVDAAEGPQFTNPSIAINVSDGPLVLLAFILLWEAFTTGRNIFVWTRMTTVAVAVLLWSIVSLLIHSVYLNDGFTTSAPYALMQDMRLVIFVVLIQSAIRTRAELALVLAAVTAAVLMQTAIVGLSYATGTTLNYGSTMVPEEASQLQGFDASGGGQLLRATGTVGQVNEQAVFHTFLTLPLIAFFVSRNPLISWLSMAIVAASSVALVLTFSRGAWVGYSVGLMVCVFFAIRRGMIGRKGMMTGIVFGLCAAIALVLLAKPIYQRLAYGDTGATAARLRLIGLAADLAEAYPLFGVGPGEFDEAALHIYPPGAQQNEWTEPGQKVESTTIGRVDYEKFQVGDFLLKRPLPVHNKYMLMLSELGIPGLFLLLYLYFEYTRVAWRCSNLSDPFLRMFGIAGLGLAAAELAYMNFEHFHDDKTIEIMYFAPAIMFVAWRNARRLANN